jgi:Cu/Ag efflux protein CusF
MRFVCALALLAPCLFAQSAAAQNAATQVVGEVASVDAASRQVTLKTDRGDTVAIWVRENAPVLRVAAGAKDLKSAPRITLADVAVGDRVAASTHNVGDRIEAGSLAVMTKSDLSEQRRREQAQWQTRGTRGIVAASDAAAHTLSVKAGQRTVTVQTTGTTDFRRYAPDSVKFSDARPSSFAEIQPDDQIRVLGDRAADGSTVTAERIVFGAFRQIAGTIRSIDVASGEITVSDLATKKPLTVRVKPDTTLKSLPAPMAAMLARRLRPGGEQEGAPGTAQRMARPGGGAGPDGGAGGMRAGGDINQMLERLPATALADLKPGDAIMMSTTAGTDPGSATAIMLLSGVEPLLTASPTATRDLMSGWMSGSGDQALSQ